MLDSVLDPVLEELQGGVAGDVLGRAEGGLLGAVDLADEHVLLILELLVVLHGQVLPGGSQPLAMSAPEIRKNHSMF